MYGETEQKVSIFLAFRLPGAFSTIERKQRTPPFTWAGTRSSEYRGGDRRSRSRPNIVGVITGSLALGPLPGLVGPVAAAGTGPSPPFKFAASARFDLTGSVTVGPSALNLTGPGMLAGTPPANLTATPAGGGAAVSGLNQIQVGLNYYFKLTGNPQWQMIDLSQTPATCRTSRATSLA